MCDLFIVYTILYIRGVQPFGVNLGHAGSKRIVLGHTLNTLQHVITKTPHNVLSEFMILCWAAFSRRNPKGAGKLSAQTGQRGGESGESRGGH